MGASANQLQTVTMRSQVFKMLADYPAHGSAACRPTFEPPVSVHWHPDHWHPDHWHPDHWHPAH